MLLEVEVIHNWINPNDVSQLAALNHVSQLANTEMDFIIGLSKTTLHKHYVR